MHLLVLQVLTCFKLNALSRFSLKIYSNDDLFFLNHIQFETIFHDLMAQIRFASLLLQQSKQQLLKRLNKVKRYLLYLWFTCICYEFLLSHCKNFAFVISDDLLCNDPNYSTVQITLFSLPYYFISMHVCWHGLNIIRCLLHSCRHLSCRSILFVFRTKQTFPKRRHEDEVRGFSWTILSGNHCIKVQRQQKVQNSINYQHDDEIDDWECSFGRQIVKMQTFQVNSLKTLKEKSGTSDSC